MDGHTIFYILTIVWFLVMGFLFYVNVIWKNDKDRKYKRKAKIKGMEHNFYSLNETGEISPEIFKKIKPPKGNYKKDIF